MSDHSTIGKAVMDYMETERNIACLEKQLSDIGKALIDLGTALRETPDHVAVQEVIHVPYTGWTPDDNPAPISIPLATLDVNDLGSITAALADAMKERDRLLPQLRRMGLQDLAYRGSG